MVTAGWIGTLEKPSSAQWWPALIALFALPMFAQSFQYMVDIPPLYLLSKAWPVLTLPLLVWALLRLDIPYKPLFIVAIFWLIGVTPMVGIVQLGNEAGAAFLTTAKVWAYGFVFSAAGLLVLLRLPPETLRRIVVGLGLGTYAIMVVLWLIVPASVYGGGDVATKLFFFDEDRGYHLYMPMFFGMLLVFFFNRSFWMRPRLWKILAIFVAFALQYVIYKERTAIAGGVLVVVIASALSARRWRFPALAMLGIVAGIAVFYLIGRSENATDIHSSLGGSLAIRQVSVATAWNYLSVEPVRWLFGVGATTRFGNITLAQLFGNRMFFLADIGWLGVAFEYGVIGALLMLLVHLAGLRAATKWSCADDPLSYALADYVLYLIVVSAVYSVVFTPGELTTVLALSYYLARVRTGHSPRDLQPVRFIPRHIALASPRPSGQFALPRPSGAARIG
jgi:hypothetical protein